MLQKEKIKDIYKEVKRPTKKGVNQQTLSTATNIPQPTT